MGDPAVSVVVPARNESGRLQPTLSTLADRRTTDHSVEFVVLDDASTDGTGDDLSVPSDADLVVERADERLGVPGARNRGAEAASGDVLFHTDAHTRHCEGWDRLALDALDYDDGGPADDRVVAATITDADGSVAGHGGRLVVPFMGTRWNGGEATAGEPVQIPSCAGTVLSADCFEHVGGYDDGMRYYGGAEPEFGVRAWLSGAEVVAEPDLTVAHEFKDEAEVDEFVTEMRPFMIHNNVRFGLCYLDERGSLQLLRHYTQEFPERAQAGFDLVAESDVWDHRERLQASLERDFSWFVDRFDLTDQAGEPVLGG